MPTKTQAKTAIDGAVVDIKSDIDNILPTGVVIRDGAVQFGPVEYSMILDAGGNAATALSWFTTIQNNLTTAGRTFTFKREDRRQGDVPKMFMIVETKLTVQIVNF